MPLARSIFLILASAACGWSQYKLQAIAGAHFPDGAQATDVSVGSILGVAVDTLGDVLVSSGDYQAVFKVKPDGTITRLTDGGYRLSLYNPTALAIDKQDSLYIADTFNGFIDKISPKGFRRVYTEDSTVDAVAVENSGTLLAGGGYGLIRVDPTGNATSLVTTEYVYGVASDAAGRAYYSNIGQVKRVNADGSATVIAGDGIRGFKGDGGPATQAQLSFPDALAFDSAGNLFIADAGNSRVRKIDLAGNISSVQSDLWQCYGNSDSACVIGPNGLAFDGSGNLFVSSTGYGGLVYKVTPTGHATVVVNNYSVRYSGDHGPALVAQFNTPEGLAFAPDGELVVADSQNYAVRRIDKQGNVQPVVTAIQSATDLPVPYIVEDVAYDSQGRLYLSDWGRNQIFRVNGDGSLSAVAGSGSSGYSGDGGPGTQAQLSRPFFLVFDRSGNLLFSDSGNNVIRKLDAQGIVTTVAGTGTAGFSGDGGLATKAQLKKPLQLALDSAGNLYFADAGNNRVRRIGADGVISTVAGTGSSGAGSDGVPATQSNLMNPYSVAVEPDGTLLIGDGGRNGIRSVDTKGIVHTLYPGVIARALLVNQSGDIYLTAFNGIFKLVKAGVRTGPPGHEGGRPTTKP